MVNGFPAARRRCSICHGPTEGRLPTCLSCVKDAQALEAERERQDTAKNKGDEGAFRFNRWSPRKRRYTI